MKVLYKNKRLEKVLIAINLLAAALVAATFVWRFGFHKPVFDVRMLYAAQVVLLFVFIAEKVIRLFNSYSAKEYLRAFWYEIPLLLLLLFVYVWTWRWLDVEAATKTRHMTVGLYLVLQVVAKLCRTVVNMASTGKNPTQTLILSFLVLIVTGAGLLMLPRSSANENVSFVDSLFTATSATCVTGLVVRDTGNDFSLMGQIVILSLIQLGGLGIVVFGAVFALLVGQALSVRESVAMQDLLSARTIGKIGSMIVFIFISTVILEVVGAVMLYGMWDNYPGFAGSVSDRWYFSVFHSISAFCNAGFGLFGSSFMDYHRDWQVFGVICPLIILGGLGFSVLYDLFSIFTNRCKRLCRVKFTDDTEFTLGTPVRMTLQSKIVLATSAILIVAGMVLLLTFEHYTGHGTGDSGGVLGALFQSITARTAGFNTINIASMSDMSKVVLILLMFIGGSPGSTAGGIKTVTFAVVIMTAFAALRKRSEVELFKRSLRIIVVGRAITVLLLFIAVLFIATMSLSITERGNDFSMSDLFFESASALGTVGLTTGITGSLTAMGKLIIIVVMLIGRLGPLTLLAALTFNLKPASYNYSSEAVIVG